MALSLDVSSAVAISSVDDLKSWVAEELDRDLADITTNLDKWILMAEARFNRELRCPEMEKTVTGSVVAEDTPLPDDFIGMRAVYIEGSPDRPLKGMSPTALRQEFSGASDIPVAYSLVGQGIRFAPPPSASTLITMDYWARIQGLSTTNPSNWLLEEHPDAYVTAVLFHYYRWSKDRDSAIDANTLCQSILDQINASANDNRYGAGPLAPNTVRQVTGARC